ncbi:galectin-3-like isoform X2 [Rhinatrema bivittatum]|nr:galectin-3-like isoform X2 [Rhinatrema bivittatum]
MDHRIKITVVGELLVNSNRFSINLVKDDKNTALHFNPRIRDSRTIVCNTKIDGVWGQEEKQEDNVPFTSGQKFKIDIECEEDYFKVYVDGKHVVTYKARYKPMSDINFLTVTGDFTVTQASISRKY